MSDQPEFEAIANLLDSISMAAVSLESLKSQDAKRILKQAMEDAAARLSPPKPQAKPAAVTTIGRPL